MRHYLACLLLGLLLSGCGEKYISSVDMGTVSKPVIGCFLTPGDSTISVSVTMSKLLYTRNQANFKVREDASVRLLSNGQTRNLTFDPSSETYTIVDPNFVVSGQIYKLEVALDGNIHSAETTVPLTYNNNLSLELVPVYENSGTRIDTNYNYTKRWQAPPGGTYYFGSIVMQETYINDTLTSIYPADDNSSSILRLLFFTASDPNKQYMRSSPRSYNDGSSFGGATFKYRFVAEILQTNLSFYQYHISLDQHWNSAGEFFIEPSPVYSSFENALGVFGSFVRSRASTPFF